jgi:hypothetical protein
MNTRHLIILLAALLCPEFAPAQNRSGLSVSKHAIRSGSAWFDASNQVVNAHGSCIVEDEGRYYLFGEFKTDSANVFIGFGCYSSQDLMNWKFERIVLPQQTDGLLGPNRIGERVKVMKCPETGEFVSICTPITHLYRSNIGYATQHNQRSVPVSGGAPARGISDTEVGYGDFSGYRWKRVSAHPPWDDL